MTGTFSFEIEKIGPFFFLLEKTPWLPLPSHTPRQCHREFHMRLAGLALNDQKWKTRIEKRPFLVEIQYFQMKWHGTGVEGKGSRPKYVDKTGLKVF